MASIHTPRHTEASPLIPIVGEMISGCATIGCMGCSCSVVLAIGALVLTAGSAMAIVYVR